jgi:hypothetical protein
MNSSTSQMIPGAARAIQNPFFFSRLMERVLRSRC